MSEPIPPALLEGNHPSSLSVTDKLAHLFELQQKFNERTGWKPPEAVEDYNLWMNRFITATQQELSELRDSIPWKWWKYQEGDVQNARVEVIDILHFVISLAQTVGMTADDLYNGYLQKNRINHTRQNNGYGAPGYATTVDDNKSIECGKTQSMQS